MLGSEAAIVLSGVGSFNCLQPTGLCLRGTKSQKELQDHETMVMMVFNG